MPHLILYIEDESAIIELVEIIVRHPDIELVSAYNAADGLRIARARKPDLTILDVMIPDRSGWSVFQEMREDPELKQMPIIMLTGQMHRYRVKKEFEQSRIDAYITKPFDVNSVRAEIEKMLVKPFWSGASAKIVNLKPHPRTGQSNGKPPA